MAIFCMFLLVLVLMGYRIFFRLGLAIGMPGTDISPAALQDGGCEGRKRKSPSHYSPTGQLGTKNQHL